MSASLPPKQKRPHSRSPDDTTIRRVRQRTGTNASATIKPVPSKRDESPEEGEVEDTADEPSISQDDGAVDGASNANGIVNGAGSKDGDSENKDKMAAAVSAKAKSKVAFPFKSRAAKVQAIPTVDMENAPPSRSAMLIVSPVKGDYSRSVGGGSRHGGDGSGGGGNGGGRDSYLPSYSRGTDSYVPSRDRDRVSPRGGHERRRSWSPPHRDDGPDGYRRGRSRSPVETWDSYVAPKYQDPAARMHKGRLVDTYVPPAGRSPNRPGWQRSSSRGRGGGDYYRSHADSPPRDRSPSDRGVYSRSNRFSPGPGPHRLPPRPASPDRYVSSRHDERPWNNYGSRDSDWDRGYYPPRTPPRSPLPLSFQPPPLPDDEMGELPSDGPQAPPVSFSRHGNGAAVLLQQQQQQTQSQPLPLPPRPPVPPIAKQQAVYTRPGPASAPAPPQVVEPKNETAPSVPPNERQEKPKTSSHKVAKVRTKEEEKAAYGHGFVGSGRINEYIIMNKLGEGTFGEVHRARLHGGAQSGSQDLALKRIIMHSEKDGMPITALREIKILKALNHPNIVKVLDIVVMPRTPNVAGSVYMVFPYMDHDLAGLLDNKAVQLAQSHIKLYMKQLLEGLEYMHENHIIHRDIKAANILISNEGILQIADFGLARAYIKKSKKARLEEGKKRGRPEKYTNCVVTRWYRPPELLLGERLYGAEIDLWGVGCILAEMFVRRPIFQGQSDMDQLEKIWWLCGTPTKENWPDFENLPGLDGVKEFKPRPKGLRDFLGRFDSITRETMDLIDALLSLDPVKRPTASTALLHDYFWTTPLPADPKTMPKYEASHELDRRRKEAPPAPPPNPHQHSYQFHGRGGGHFNNFNRGGGGGSSGPMGRGGLSVYRPYNSGGAYPMGMGHMPGPPGLSMHPGMQAAMQGPPPHGVPFPPHLNQHQQHQGPPPNANGPGLPPPRGFRPPPVHRGPYQQPPFPGNYGGRPPGPNNGPPGMQAGPPRDRGPPAPPSDSMVLHYG